MIYEKSIRQFCSEDPSLIENYNEAVSSPEKWVCHHRGEILPCGRYTPADLKKFGLYYHRPASELVFLTRNEHTRIHKLGNKNCLGKHRTEATKEKLRQAHLGKRLSDAAKEKLRQLNLGKRLSDETKAKMSQKWLGKKWYNNGVKCVRARECPPGFVPGRIKRV